MDEKNDAESETPQKAPISVPLCANGTGEGIGKTRETLRVRGRTVPIPTVSPCPTPAKQPTERPIPAEGSSGERAECGR